MIDSTSGNQQARDDAVRRESIRVQLADTDAAAVLYLAAPLRWSEGIFTRWLADSGHPIGAILASGVGFPVVKAEVIYIEATHVDDLLDCAMFVTATGRRSVDLLFTYTKAGGASSAVEARIRHVYSATNPGETVHTLPDWFAELCSPRTLSS